MYTCLFYGASALDNSAIFVFYEYNYLEYKYHIYLAKKISCAIYRLYVKFFYRSLYTITLENLLQKKISMDVKYFFDIIIYFCYFKFTFFSRVLVQTGVNYVMQLKIKKRGLYKNTYNKMWNKNNYIYTALFPSNYNIIINNQKNIQISLC